MSVTRLSVSIRMLATTVTGLISGFHFYLRMLVKDRGRKKNIKDLPTMKIHTLNCVYMNNDTSG